MIYWILLAIAALALIFGAILGFASVKFKAQADPLAEKIDAVLPQSQCGQCGYPGCKPYADAIVAGDVITKCVPGGQATVIKIAEILGVDVPTMDDVAEPEVQVAFINENMCIGCTKCIQACPVDAIIGTNKQVHTVIPDLCTGCTLCVAPCPTDCISMVPVVQDIDHWDWKLLPNVIPVKNIETAVQEPPVTATKGEAA